MKKRDVILLGTGVLAVSVFPLVFAWMNNADRIKETTEIWQNLALLSLCAVALFGVFALFYRNLPRAALSTTVVVLIFENGLVLQNILTRLFPRFHYWHTTTVLLVVAVVILYLFTKIKDDVALTVGKVVSLVFIGLVVLNIVMGVPKIILANRVSTEEKTSLALAAGSGRNMYWLLFDNYSSNYVYNKWFDFDNSAFTETLEDMGFNVSSTSENDSTYTISVTANIANLGYVTSFSYDRTYTECVNSVLESRRTAVIIPLAESYGYEITGVGHAEYYGFTGTKAVSSSSAGMTLGGDSIVSLFWKRTILAPFAEINVNELAAEMLAQLQYLQDPGNIPQSHSFVLAHFNTPHTPYLFLADGTLVQAGNTADIEENTSLYLEQSKFVSGEMLKIVETIIKNDPNAIIILSSDHANKSKAVEYDDRRRIFAAMYNGGEPMDIEGMSGMNLMITMLNEALGTDIDYVELVAREEVIF